MTLVMYDRGQEKYLKHVYLTEAAKHFHKTHGASF